jgi:hypothetical protein
MAVAGHIVANLTANTQGWVSGLKAAESPLAAFESKLGRFMALVTGAFGFSKLILSASDLQETQSKFDTVFGQNAESARAWGNDYANAVGRSRRQVSMFMAEAQDLFVPLGFDTSSAQQISQTLTSLSTDLASFNNMRDQDVFGNLISGLMGESEPLKKYGVIVNEAAVKQELFNQSIDPSKATDQQKVLARLNIILRMTTAAQGDAIRTGGGWANQWKRLTSVADDLAGTVGSKLLPPLTEGLKLLNAVVVSLEPPLSALAGWIGDVVGSNTSWLPVLAGTAVAILGVVTVMKAITVATMVYAKAQAIATALSGPKGWAMLGVGLAAAAVATGYLSDEMDDINRKSAEATSQQDTLKLSLHGTGGAFGSAADAAKSYATEVSGMRKEYDSFLPKHIELSNKLKQIETDWRKAAAAGEQGILTFSQMKGLQLRTMFAESGFTGMFDDLTSELRVLRGEIDETGLKFEQMAAMGVDQRHIDTLKAMVAEQKQLTKANEEQEKLKDERQQRIADVRGRVDEYQQGNRSPLAKFKDEVTAVQEAIESGAIGQIEAFRYLESQRKTMLKESAPGIEGQQASNTGADSRTEQGNQMVLDLINRRAGVDDANKKEQEDRERESVELLRDIRNAAVANGMKTKPFNQRGSRA